MAAYYSSICTNNWLKIMIWYYFKGWWHPNTPYNDIPRIKTFQLHKFFEKKYGVLLVYYSYKRTVFVKPKWTPHSSKCNDHNYFLINPLLRPSPLSPSSILLYVKNDKREKHSSAHDHESTGTGTGQAVAPTLGSSLSSWV